MLPADSAEFPGQAPSNNTCRRSLHERAFFRGALGDYDRDLLLDAPEVSLQRIIRSSAPREQLQTSPGQSDMTHVMERRLGI